MLDRNLITFRLKEGTEKNAKSCALRRTKHPMHIPAPAANIVTDLANEPHDLASRRFLRLETLPDPARCLASSSPPLQATALPKKMRCTIG